MVSLPVPLLLLGPASAPATLTVRRESTSKCSLRFWVSHGVWGIAFAQLSVFHQVVFCDFVVLWFAFLPFFCLFLPFFCLFCLRLVSFFLPCRYRFNPPPPPLATFLGSLFRSPFAPVNESYLLSCGKTCNSLSCLVLHLPVQSLVCLHSAVVLSCLVLSCPVLFCLVLSCLVWSCLVLSCLVFSRLVLSCLLLSCLVFCCLVLSCLFLSCLVLFCLVFSGLVLSCLPWSCLVLCLFSCSCSQSSVTKHTCC